MDRLGFDRAAFDTIVAAYRALADRLGAGAVHRDPGLGARGRQRRQPQPRACPGTHGPSLLAWLESAPSEIDALRAAEAPFRFPVQLVLRGFEAKAAVRRGYAGRVGERRRRARSAAEVQIQPGGATARIAAIETHDGRLPQALSRAVGGAAPRPRARRLARRPDSSPRPRRPASRSRFAADLAWLDDEPSRPGAGSGCAMARATSWRASSGSSGPRPRRGSLARPAPARRRWRATTSPGSRSRRSSRSPSTLRPVRGGGAFVLVDAARIARSRAGMIRAEPDAAND